MKLDAHGGDLLAMASVSKRDPASLLDFSVNVRPEGAPEFLRAALVRANTGLAAYPSPNAEEALAAAARRYGLPAGRFAFGNGSNELIHALARVLKRRGAPCVSIVEPAFSEYALACRLAGLESSPLWGGIGSGADGQPSGDLLAGLAETPSGSAVFLANPCNPSGLFRTPDECLSLLAARPDLVDRLMNMLSADAGKGMELSGSSSENLLEQGVHLMNSALCAQSMLLGLPRPAEHNESLAASLGRAEMPPAHALALDHAVADMRARFGADCLPVGDSAMALNGWNSGERSAVSTLLARDIRASATPVTSGDLAALFEARAHDAAANGAFRGLLGEMARRMGLNVDADGLSSVSYALRQRHPELADAIAANAQVAVRQSKAAVRRGLQTDMATGAAYESEAFAVCFATVDQKEAMRAFLNKEKVTAFQNR